jgi:hypothetical protein
MAESKSPMHKSVYRRFETGSVLLYDRMAAYWPDNIRVHIDFKHYFGGGAAQLPNASLMKLNRSGKMPAMSGGSDLHTTSRKWFCRTAFESPWPPSRRTE